MAIDGIVFDLDGTLWDSCRVVAESWTGIMQKSYDEKRVFTSDDIKSIMGLAAGDICKKLFSCYGDRAMEICLGCMNGELEYIADHSGDVYPGVEEMLSELSKSYPLFIVSNCQDGYIQCFFKCTGLGRYIKDIECEGATGLNKADNIRLICRRNSLKAPVYLGDTAGDEKSAKAAGCLFVHAAYGFGKAEAPDAVLAAPKDLLQLINTLKEEKENV